jgi:DNA modification methylase
MTEIDSFSSLFELPQNRNATMKKPTRTRRLKEESRISSSGLKESDYGTFKDSLRAPIHRWFKYPAGYSYRLVEAKIRQYGLNQEHWILDPFVGSGTTVVEAKRQGVQSIGIEVHPFVYWVAHTKINWNLSLRDVVLDYQRVIEVARNLLKKIDICEVPELVQKCYSSKNLISLMAIRDAIRQEVHVEEIKNFLNLALTDTLRNASRAATGWPYIAPTKRHEKVTEKEAFMEFDGQIRRMVEDLESMQNYYRNEEISCNLIFGDAKDTHPEIKDESMDLALTSPPYLNNYDYADRTRLETYFFGWYKSWSEITSNVRDRLMISATTQIRREEFKKNNGISDSIRQVDLKFFNELKTKVKILSERRLNKGGKKSYDCLVAGYFSDMFQVFKQVYRALKPKAHFALVLGDSAPYGVYIPTHEYLARMATAIGFSSWHVEDLRTRGDKWRDNPQRHKVKLKEVILTLTK